MRLATPSATTTSTWPGTRSPETGSGSLTGWRSTSMAPCQPAILRANADLHSGRDDDSDRSAVAARRDDMLRRHRPAERGGKPGSCDARAESRPDLRVGNDRLEARSGAAVDR